MTTKQYRAEIDRKVNTYVSAADYKLRKHLKNRKLFKSAKKHLAFIEELIEYHNNKPPMSDTNLKKWMYYQKDCVSPEVFIKWSLLSAVCSSLERRVWTGSIHEPLFNNIYTILVAPPGVGKGRAIYPIRKMLEAHKLEKGTQDSLSTVQNTGNNKTFDCDQAIQIGSDSGSYQALVKELSDATRAILYTTKEGTKRPYGHASLTLCLEEMSSLFRKHLEELVNFLLVAYDCGNYTYNSIARNKDKIRACCLNILAGTTPGFIKEIFGDELITDGFSSRAFFVCATEPRFRTMIPSEYCDAQLQARDDVYAHIKKLTQLYGEVKFTQEALDYMQIWWINEPSLRVNKSPKLIPYYARKNIHLRKVAVALHFMEHTTMVVGLEEVREAIIWTDYIETTMHSAVTMDNKNPLVQATNDILYYITTHDGGVSTNSLLLEFIGQLPMGEESLNKILDYLNKVQKIRYNSETHKWEIIV